jgi:hypothetical protein
MDTPEETTQHKQVKQFSGNVIHPNLDDASLYYLKATQAEHKKRGSNPSQSVLVRRAIRFYGDFVMRMTEEEYLTELLETKRAAKGVL